MDLFNNAGIFLFKYVCRAGCLLPSHLKLLIIIFRNVFLEILLYSWMKNVQFVILIFSCKLQHCLMAKPEMFLFIFALLVDIKL
jgi:hypothetical protein